MINQLKYAAGKSGFVFCEYWELKCVGSGPIVTRGTVLGYPKCLSRSRSHGIRATLSCFIWNKLSYPIAKSWTLVQWGRVQQNVLCVKIVELIMDQVTSFGFYIVLAHCLLQIGSHCSCHHKRFCHSLFLFQGLLYWTRCHAFSIVGEPEMRLSFQDIVSAYEVGKCMMLATPRRDENTPCVSAAHG